MPSARALLLVKCGLENAGRRQLDTALTEFDSHQIDILTESPQSPREVERAVARYADAVDRIIVAGGDGSVNIAAGALLKANLPVGILPLGTANDLARSLGIPQDMTAATEIIAHDHLRRIDIAQVNDAYFLNVAHIGLAARVALQADSQAKKYLGPLAYFVESWNAFRAQRSFSVDIRCDGESLQRRVMQISIGNGVFYGGGTPIAEDAAIDDGLLDLYALPALSGGRLMALVPLLRAGRTRKAEDILTLKGTEIEVRTRKARAITADGEQAGDTPARFRVIPGALSVYTSSPTARPGRLNKRG